MDIVSLLTASSPKIVADSGEETTNDKALSNSAFKDMFSRMMQEPAAEEVKLSVEETSDPAFVQAVGAHLAMLSGHLQEQGGDTPITQEEAEAWVQEMLEASGIEADLSMLDREKIIQIILGIEEEALEGEPVEATDDESDAQHTIAEANGQGLVDPTGLDAGAARLQLVEIDEQEAVAAAIEVQAAIQETILTVSVAPAALKPTGTVADAAIKQALLRAREAFDRMAQVIPQDGEAAAATAVQNFRQMAGEWVATESDARKDAAQSAPISREQAATIVANSAATRGLEQQAQATLDAPGISVDTGAKTAEQAAIAGNKAAHAANTAQHHSALAWEANAQATDRAYTIQPGARHGGAADQVKIGITQGLKAGFDAISVQLEPADLGRVEVRLEVQDGRAQVLVTANKQDTLDMLQRDARALEQALAEAGIEADTSGMEFMLGGNEGQEGDDSESGSRASGIADAADTEMEVDNSLADINYTVSVEQGLNIRV